MFAAWLAQRWHTAAQLARMVVRVFSGRQLQFMLQGRGACAGRGEAEGDPVQQADAGDMCSSIHCQGQHCDCY